ncbi:MAG: ADP-ribosylglycohydrolase family protein [Polyangiaceae bacterium]|nr:ADP-ribosylglycohydrolase family protein [Polyangiaceae bacterium]
MSPSEQRICDRLRGCLLGSAVGDSIGLPREGLSPRRAALFYGPIPLQHRFFLGRGMVSDDTEHAALTARALLHSGGEITSFTRSLAWRLRAWFLTLPVALGWATLRALVKLCAGFPPAKSGVFSAGNGPAMRAPILGAFLSNQPDKILPFVQVSTRITHTDPRAQEGALVIALAAAHGLEHGPSLNAGQFWESVESCVRNEELRSALKKVETALSDNLTLSQFSTLMGFEKGVTGYMLHTVPAVLFCWLKTPGDVRAAVENVVSLGGDADTTGAIVGALAGATAGASAIPKSWVDNILDWPLSTHRLTEIADQLAAVYPLKGQSPPTQPPQAWFRTIPRLLALPIRNFVFLLIVLAHGFRRVAPPY